MKIPCLFLTQKDNNIRSIPSKKYLCTCFENEISRYKNSIIIDSNQNIYYIKNANKIGWGNWLGGFSIWYKHRLISIEYIVETEATLSLDEIKNIIIKKIEQKPYGKFMLQYFGSIENLKSKVLASTILKEVMNLFLEDD